MLDVFTRKAIKLSIKYILLGEKEIIQMPTPSISSDEFSRVIRSHVESAADNNKAREEKKQRSKKANTSTIISQHKSASCGGGESIYYKFCFLYIYGCGARCCRCSTWR
jgi:hypothetical protein